MHRSQHSEPLGSHLQPSCAEGFGQIGRHTLYLIQFWTQSRAYFAFGSKSLRS
jgi:hypothetical protein